MKIETEDMKELVWALAAELNANLGHESIIPEQQNKTKRNLSLVMLGEENLRLAIRPPSKHGFYVAPTSHQCAIRMTPYLRKLTGKENHGFYQPNEREPYWYLPSFADVRKAAYFFAGIPQSPSVYPDELNSYQQNFEAEVITSLRDEASARLKRLSTADRLPKQKLVSTTVFLRNPDVVAEALLRAGGVCEGCLKPAPFFRRSDHTPYLEVHHKIRLIDGGEDVLENVLALCPNCHRRLHYGAGT